MRGNPTLKQLLIAALAAALLIFGVFVGGGFVDLRAAQDAFAAQDYAAAAAAYESASNHLFWRGDLWVRAGESALLAGEPQETIRLLGDRAGLGESAALTLAQAHLRLGDLDSALQTYATAIATHGGSAALHGGRAAIYRIQGDYAAERVALQDQLKYAPDDAAANYRLGLLLSLSEPEAALERLLLAAGTDERFDPAAQTLRTALNLAALETDAARRLVVIGRGLALVSEWSLAAQAFAEAVRADAGNADAWAWLGEAKQQLGVDGRAELDQALTLNRSSVIVHALRGLYWKRVGSEREALAEYQAAAELEPQNPTWKTALGETYARLGDLVSALSVYQRATELAPRDPGTWRLLATFCVEYGVQVRETGLPAAAQAVALAPANAPALDVLGWNQLALGWFVSAEQSLLSAIEIDPDLVTAHLHLAMVYLQTGDRAGAHEHLARVLELDPHGPFGQQAAIMLNQNGPE